MNMLIIGGGGREHALAWKLAQSPTVTQVFVAPGNPGTAWHASVGRCASSNVAIHSDDIPALLAFVQINDIGLTLVGPEAPLAAGIVDAFAQHGLAIFGATQAAAKLEYSKAFAKEMMRTNGVPTANYEVFAQHEHAIKFVRTLPFGSPQCVVKADGLAAGKGVFVCDTLPETEDALARIMLAHEFGDAGERVVIEARLQGKEVSCLAFVDGTHVAMMPPARDHKRVGEGDTGPNTGGMGVFAPVPNLPENFLETVRQTVMQPVVDGLRVRGTPYVGVLYAGLMLTPDHDLNVLEFNCRFGDPETQVLLPLLENDLAQVLLSCVAGQLDPSQLRWHNGACASVVMASQGYPGAYAKGLPISGLDQLPAGVFAFHAGTAAQGDAIVTNGGRVLNVTARGATMNAALHSAYAGVERIHFAGAHFRRDIGKNTAQ